MNVPLPNFLPRQDDLILGRTGPWSVFPAFRLRAAQRATHMYVLGITGQGKSKLLEHCLFQDIVTGRGCGLLDPHTDLAQDLLTYLATSGFFEKAENRERIIYFDPSRRDYLIPFNVLASSYSPYTVATNLIEAFRRTWPESLREAPRFTNILLASLLTLIANSLTLVDLPRMLTDQDFREALLNKVSDPEVVSVFHERLDRWGREQPLILESILNKVSALTINPTLKAILGQKENRLDFRKMMDEGKVFIADLGRCDGETRKLLGSLIVTGIEQAALSRKDESARSRTPFYFYIDEFQDFVANEGSVMTLAQILSESRKFGLHLTLAHQTLGQMTSERMRAALGNIGTKIVFAVDRVDAEIMVKKLFQISGEDIKHEVEDEIHQEKTHPVFYSLAEEWEQATQQIQNLKPRTALVKAPQRAVAKIHTIPIPQHSLSEQELEDLRLMLQGRVGQPITNLQMDMERHNATSEITDYEVVETLTRQRVTQLDFQVA